MSWSKGLDVNAGGHQVVSHVGSAATRLLGDRAGLTGALSGALARRGFVPLHDRGRVLTDLAVAIADGATTIGDIDPLRHQGELFGLVAWDTTAWRTLSECDGAALTRVERARAKVRRHVCDLIEARHGGIPPAKAAGRDLGEVIVVRIDATVIVAHSDKQQARGTLKGTYGHHPLTGWCDNTGESLAVQLRPGNAGSNTAADRISVIGASIAQIPARHRRKMLFTCDGAGSTHALVEHVTALNARPGYQVHYSSNTRGSAIRSPSPAPPAARSSSSKPATEPRQGWRTESAARKAPAWDICRPATTWSTPPGARPPPSPATYRPGCGSSPSTATWPKPSPRPCATGSSTQPGGSSKDSAAGT